MFQGQDFGLCGPSYQAPLTLQDAQDAINYYIEADPEQHAKEPLAMLGAPGLNPILSPLYVIPGTPPIDQWVYTGTMTAGQVGTSIGFFEAFIHDVYGSISPTTDTHGNTITTLAQMNNSQTQLIILSSSTLTQSYFSTMALNGVNFLSANATFVNDGAGAFIWTWNTIANLADEGIYPVTLALPSSGGTSSTSISGGQARAFWVLPGGQQALYVSGSTLWLIKVATPATTTSIAQLAATYIGTLLTSTGPVSIRDNGALQNGEGGYALIVDGTYGYYYLLSGTTYSNTFTGGVNSGSPTIVLPGSLPNGLIVASTPTLSDASGFILGNTLITYVDTIGLTITMSNPAVGTIASESITLTIPPFGRITDPGFLGSYKVAFIEGWFVCAQPNSRTFFTTGPTAYQILFPGAFFALKDSSSDNIVTLQENNRELWLIGERTSEVWYGSGLQNFYFSRIPGVGPQIGCAALSSITRVGADLMWLGKNEQGENWVVTSNFYTFQRISNHGVEHAISQYPVVSDAIGYAYEEEGHLFYMLNFPTADVTWCYDATTKQWHKRLSFNPVTATYHRHRGNCYMDFQDIRIVGDYQTGVIHQMSRTIYTDAGAPLRAVRRTPHVWQKENRQRVFFSQLQIEFNPGVGLQTGQGSSPQAMLKWSDDGGYTWGQEQWSTIGAAGETRNRAIWYMLGESRDRVWEVAFTDPVPRDIIGATCYMEAASG